MDEKYTILAENLECDEFGQVLSFTSMVKNRAGQYIKTGLTGQIFGYKKSMPIAEIAEAKSSQCAYSSFEMPIESFRDENNWAVYEFRKEGEVSNYVDIINQGFTGGKSIRVNYSYGPTFSLTLNNDAPLVDYIFEAWVKRSENLPLESRGKLVAYLHRGNDFTPIFTPEIQNSSFSATDEWQKIQIVVPLCGKIIPEGLGELKLRLYSESLKSGTNSPPSMQGFLIDECRVYPKGALMKTTSIDLETGSTFSVDAKGIMMMNHVTPYYLSEYDRFLNLIKVSTTNFSK